MSPTGASEPPHNGTPPAVHLTDDPGVQAYTEPYPRVDSDGSHRAAFIPGRTVVRVVAVRGAWAQLTLDDQIVGWVEGSHLLPPIGQRIIVPPPRNQSSSATAPGQAINVDTLVAVLAGIGIIIGAVMDWTQGIAVNSFKLPFAFLFDSHTTSTNPRIGHFVVALGIAGVILAFVRSARALRGVVGLAVLGIAVLYCAQVAVGLSDANSNQSFTDIVGAGPWLTGIAGIALAVSAFLSPDS